ncbi:copper resistance protein CopZ [Roseovarius faecimaris]|uniref:Copper resistance protein CopZ n=1 Tax=Roseovarius faecimaris TaxID=2494550 RepID=A0A6I6IQM8_9RHOB|nr:nitrous oxide reductase accessory protein NosL [Roseovarius faecimaris]QGX98374.1 copper resistance protein CopZ [Roseovarius faecimaris]
MRVLLLTCALLALAACKEEEVIRPLPVALTEDAVSHYCQMNVMEHGGPKAQIHLDGLPDPLFFGQVRDAVAFLKSPERDNRVLATYVSDMGAAESWLLPGTTNWIDADTAHFVIEAGVRGGMGAPEVVPFAEPGDAAAFVSEFGGRVVGLADIPDTEVTGPVDPDMTLQEPAS